MAKTKISEFSSTPANNTDINGINIAEGCAPSGINNAIRQLMADLKDFQAGTAGDPLTVGGALTVTGTTALSGAATAPTPATSDSSTNIATTAYVTNKIAASTSGLSDPGGSGIVVRTATAGATVARTITAGTGISVSNGNGVSGNPTITNSGVTSFNGSTGAVTGVASVNGQTGSVTTISQMTEKTATGTAIDFTGIPSGVKRITVMFSGVSTSGSSFVQTQIGTSGGVVTTGYTAYAGMSAANVSLTTGFIAEAGGAAAGWLRHGHIVLTLIDSSTSRWIMSGSIGLLSGSTGYGASGGGSVTLSGTLDRIRITTVNGTDAFDAGSVNVLYE